MAEANKTIDPNDLDSIDALLDEAEFDLNELDEGNPQPSEKQAIAASQDEQLSESTQAEDELAEEVAIDPELSAVEEQALNDMLDLDESDFESTSNASAAMAMPEVGSPRSRQLQDDTDDFIARRAQGAHKSDELTVEEMDSIKKMLIGFGLGLSVLVIIAIVMASWAAFGSKTDSTLESSLLDVKEELEITRVAAQANERSLRELNRKLDAVSFQVEQLSADVMSQNPTNTMVLRGGAPMANEQPAQPVTAPTVSTSAEAKIDSLARNLAVAQRRIVEINNRVTSMQTQQGSVLQAVKSVEKTLLEKQLTVSDSTPKDKSSGEVSAEKSNTRGTGYRYQAPVPTGLIHQSGHGSIYP